MIEVDGRDTLADYGNEFGDYVQAYWPRVRSDYVIEECVYVETQIRGVVSLRLARTSWRDVYREERARL